MCAFLQKRAPTRQGGRPVAVRATGRGKCCGGRGDHIELFTLGFWRKGTCALATRGGSTACG